MPVCFWEDLVNTVQAECGPGGGVDGVISYAGSAGNCGGAIGKFYLNQSYANAALDAALTIAAEVTITGVYQDDILAGDFETALESAIPEYVTLTDVDYPMSFTDVWETANIPALDATFGQWFRLDVDGTIYYAAGVLRTPC